MVKAPIKRKQKKVVKQKQKQNVNVKQNVKVVVGDVKKKRAVKSSGTKTGTSAKPPIVLNISNPQPLNNTFMEYFKKQFQNQQPIQANTLAQQVKLNEREETKASKAGLLHNLDKEPDDMARELSRLKIEQVERIRQSDSERKEQNKEMQLSIRKAPKPTKPIPTEFKGLQTQITPIYKIEEPQPSQSQTEMLEALEQQRSQTEMAIDKSGGAGAGEESGGTGTGDEADLDEPRTPIRKYKDPSNPIKEEKPKRKRGRKPLTEEVIKGRLAEEARLQRDRIGMEEEDVKKRRGPKRITQEEKDRRRKEREVNKMLQKMTGQETEEDY